MKVISHRAYINGPDESRENNPDAIEEALKDVLYVEVDIRLIGGDYYLGHDKAKYKVPKSFLRSFKDNLIIHAKDLASAESLARELYYPHWFYHETDPMTITSKGWPWLYPGLFMDVGVILNFKNPNDPYFGKLNSFALCTDWPLYFLHDTAIIR